MSKYSKALNLLIMHLIPLVLYREYQLFNLPAIEYFRLFILAIFCWTFIEYAAHRWFFHKLKRRTPVLLNFIIFYALLYLITPLAYLNTFFIFILLGYMGYNQVHIRLHSSPISNPIGKYLQNFHLYHHSKMDKIRYGITSPFWDHVFGTIDKK